MSRWTKSDPALEDTEKRLAELEAKIAQVYEQAAKDIQHTVEAYFEAFADRDAEMRQQMEDGRITAEQYKQWRITQIARGKRYEAMRDAVAERVTNANQVAIAYVNDATPEVYSLNRNYSNYTINKQVGGAGFTLWSEDAVRRLLRDDPDTMPYYPPERAVERGIDLKYGQTKITESVTSSILQGRSVRDTADELQRFITAMSRESAVRAARTAMTSAQNGGRLDSYKAAEKMGIKVKKRWIATKDSRTRHSHRRMDGETVDIDKPFSNGCRYPGDPRGKPAEVYNCRCSMRTVDARNIEAEPRQMRVRDPRTGRNVLVREMTYTEWEQWVKDNGGGV